MRRSCASSTARWRGLAPTSMGSSSLRLWRFSAPLAPTGSLLDGILLPAALIVVSLFRLISWFRARAVVELEALDLVRRKVHVATLLGPMLTFAFALTAAIATWRDGVAEFALALLAVWVVAAVCAICLNVLASEAIVIVVAATAPLIVAFLVRGAELTLGLAALVVIAACFVIRMLDEHFRMFAEIVRSRLVIAETQRVAEEARQAAMTIALTDDLTGLPNRRCFQSLLADRIRTATETGEPFALGLIDLDGFKPINDAHGHPVGDQILSQVADRLAKAMEWARLSREDRRRRIRCPLRWDRRARRGDCARAGNPDDIRDPVRRVPARRSFDLGLRLCALSRVGRGAGRPGASGRRCALPRQGQRAWRRGRVRRKSRTNGCLRRRLRGRLSSRGRRIGGRRPFPADRRLGDWNSGFKLLAPRGPFAPADLRQHSFRPGRGGVIGHAASRLRRKLALGREGRTIAR